MTERAELVIENDDQLRPYGVFTAENIGKHTIEEPVLTRQDFRDAEEEAFDVYPSDKVFLRTVITAIELGSGRNLSIGGWAGPSQPATYIWTRRPSQPDFQIPVSTVNDIFVQSRFRVSSLLDAYDAESGRRNVLVLREALARKSLESVMTLAEYESPLRVSGDVFVSPLWRREALEKDPRMVTLADFLRQMRKMRARETMALVAFHQLGSRLLDEGRSDYPNAHNYITELYFKANAGSWLDFSTAIFSFDLIAAYRAAVDGISSDSLLSGNPKNGDGDMDANLLQDLAYGAVLNKIPGSWLKDGRFIPPRQETEFDF